MLGSALGTSRARPHEFVWVGGGCSTGRADGAPQLAAEEILNLIERAAGGGVSREEVH